MSLTELAGKRVVVTGTLASMSHDQASAWLRSLGAKVTGDVSSKTDLVVHGVDPGETFAKAHRLGIRVVPEAALVAAHLDAGSTEPLLGGALARIAALEARAYGPARPIVDLVWADQRRRWGMTLGELLRVWIRVFSTRPDVKVQYAWMPPPPSPGAVARLADQLPPTSLALGAEHGQCRFVWVLTRHLPDVDLYDEGYNGGKLHLVLLEGGPWFERRWSVDKIVAEGNTHLVFEPGGSPTDAKVVFHDDNDVVDCPFDTLEEYLARGAARAFARYWQNPSAGEAPTIVAELAAVSMPRDTPAATVIRALEERGCSEAEASALHRWLGPDVTMLLPTPKVPAGPPGPRPGPTPSRVFPTVLKVAGTHMRSASISGRRVWWVDQTSVRAIDVPDAPAKRVKPAWSTEVGWPGALTRCGDELVVVVYRLKPEENELVWLDPEDGRVLRRAPAPHIVTSTWVDGTLYAASEHVSSAGLPTYELASLDPATGAVRARFARPEVSPRAWVDVARRSRMSVPFGGRDTKLFAATDQSALGTQNLEVVCLDASGRPSWNAGRVLDGADSGALNDTFAVVAGGGGSLAALDARTGAVLWRSPEGGARSRGAPTLHGGRVFHPVDGITRARSAADGFELGVTEKTTPWIGGLVASDELLVGITSTHLHVFDVR